MSKVLPTSHAGWMETHGFGVLCIRDAEHERFIVIPAGDENVALLQQRGFRLWKPETEASVSQQLASGGVSPEEIRSAIHLARDWATTVTRRPDAPRVLWGADPE